jgi:preprotein translocase subunit SecB
MSANSMKDLTPQLAQLAAAVDLIEVRPVGFLARLLRAAPQTGTPLAMDMKNQLEVRHEGDGEFQVHADFALVARPEADPKDEFLKIRYTILSRYRVPPEYPLDQEVLELFAHTNGMVHLWPYLRAFVSNACAQLGVQPITLPPFRVQSAKPSARRPAPATS